MSGEAELSSGQALIAEGRFAEAAIHLEAAAGGFASVGSLREESHAAWLASVALRQTGDVNAARRFLQRSAGNERDDSVITSEAGKEKDPDATLGILFFILVKLLVSLTDICNFDLSVIERFIADNQLVTDL